MDARVGGWTDGWLGDGCMEYGREDTKLGLFCERGMRPLGVGVGVRVGVGVGVDPAQ